MHGLALGGVEDEDDVVGLHRGADLLHLLEERRLLAVAPRSVDNDHFVALSLELLHAARRDLHWVRLGVRPVEGAP